MGDGQWPSAPGWECLASGTSRPVRRATQSGGDDQVIAADPVQDDSDPATQDALKIPFISDPAFI